MHSGQGAYACAHKRQNVKHMYMCTSQIHTRGQKDTRLHWHAQGHKNPLVQRRVPQFKSVVLKGERFSTHTHIHIHTNTRTLSAAAVQERKPHTPPRPCTPLWDHRRQLCCWAASNKAQLRNSKKQIRQKHSWCSWLCGCVCVCIYVSTQV